jgi:hypothetical protein
MLVPGLYVSLHNWVAHDYLSLKSAFDLSFAFNTVNWLVYCSEDIYRPGRWWSDPQVESEQKGLLRAFVESLDPPVAATVQARIAARPAPARRPLHRRLLRRLVPRSWRRLLNPLSPSIEVAIERSIAGRN